MFFLIRRIPKKIIVVIATNIFFADTAFAVDITPNQNANQSSGINFQFGGYIKLDAMVSQYDDGIMAAKIGRDFFIPATIPVGGEKSDAQFDMSAKTSRFFLKTKSQLDEGEILTHIELDFIESLQGDERFANSYSPRLRHAYVKWNYDGDKSITAGQTWSNFFNVSALPELEDFVGPVGTIFAIQPQIAFQYGHLKFSAENPATTFQSQQLSTIEDNSRVPDLTVSYNGQVGNSTYYLAALTRELASNINGEIDYKRTIAITASGKFKLGARDDIRVMVNYGDGLGRYTGFGSFLDSYTTPQSEFKAITQSSGFIAIRHYWNNNWRSSFVISASNADYDADINVNPAKHYSSVHANLLYTPAPGIDVGVELIRGEKKLLNDDSGTFNRLQFGMKYSF